MFFDTSFGECLVNGTKSFWSLSAGNKNAFAFFSYIQLRSCFSTLQLFLKPSTATNFNQKTTGVRWRPQVYVPTCETNSQTWFSLKFLNVGNKPNLLKLVFVLFSSSYYLESSKVYSGLKMVRVLKRLGSKFLGT